MMTNAPAPRENPEKLALPEQAGGSLWPVAAKAIGCVCVLIVVAYFVSGVVFKDRYVVDFYPPQGDSKQPTLVIRWPSQQAQLEPISLPSSLATDGSRWQAKQPKRATLRFDTILPAGEILEVDENPPPGRFILLIGREKVEVSPESNWVRK